MSTKTKRLATALLEPHISKKGILIQLCFVYLTSFVAVAIEEGDSIDDDDDFEDELRMVAAKPAVSLSNS